MLPRRSSSVGAAVVAAVMVGGHPAPAARAAAAVRCSDGAATRAAVGRPTHRVAWRAGVVGRTAVYDRRRRGRRLGWVRSSDASWLLILRARRLSGGRCMVRVRLPWRPNRSAGWVDGRDVVLAPTPWRIAVSRSRRTLTLTRSGRRAEKVRVVVGKPSTPTPRGLFAIADATRGSPYAFTGSWVLALTAHSDVLQRFDGGDGTVGLHGRGGASLRDPLGHALSHGCIRLANRAIDALVRRVGRYDLPGTPVEVR